MGGKNYDNDELLRLAEAGNMAPLLERLRSASVETSPGTSADDYDGSVADDLWYGVQCANLTAEQHGQCRNAVMGE